MTIHVNSEAPLFRKKFLANFARINPVTTGSHIFRFQMSENEMAPHGSTIFENLPTRRAGLRWFFVVMSRFVAVKAIRIVKGCSTQVTQETSVQLFSFMCHQVSSRFKWFTTVFTDVSIVFQMRRHVWSQAAFSCETLATSNTYMWKLGFVLFGDFLFFCTQVFVYVSSSYL